MNKNNKKEETVEVTKKVLLLLATGAFLTTLMICPGMAYVGKEFLKWKKFNKKRLRETVNRLKDQKMVTFTEKDEQTIIEITEKGRKRALKYKLDDLLIKKPKKWNGMWHIVIFDIPEKKKLAREVLRTKLKELDFYRLQKSVFVHPYPCRDEIDFIKEIYEVSPYINLIVAKSIDQEEKLKDYFNLQ